MVNVFLEFNACLFCFSSLATPHRDKWKTRNNGALSVATSRYFVKFHSNIYLLCEVFRMFLNYLKWKFIIRAFAFIIACLHFECFPLLSQAGKKRFVIRKTTLYVDWCFKRYQNGKMCAKRSCFVNDFILSILDDHKIEYKHRERHTLFTLLSTYLLILNDSSSLL